MSLKNWILQKMNGLSTRADLPRSPVLRAGAVASPAVIRRNATRASLGTAPGRAAPATPDLGPYAPLISAIREDLEHFVVSYLRLHLAIAERDRYVLTSIDVRATGSDDAAELLRRFIREFRPEQIKHYLAREIIGGLPNASAIDLSQFAGLNTERGVDDAEDDDGYSELLAELRSAKPTPGVRTYEVSLIGRWSEVGSAAGLASRSDIPRTPLAGRSAEIAIEDAGGKRRVVLPSVVPGRRYAIGKGEGCDIVVNGVYASRRHCEIWLDHGAWWVTDTGSTNGVRIDRGTRERRRRSRRGRGHARCPHRALCARRRQRGRLPAPDDRRRTRHVGVRDTDCPGRGLAGDAFHADRCRAITGERIDDRRAHGLGRAHRRASRRRAAVLRRSLAQPGAGDRLGARGRVGTSHRHRRDRRDGRHRRGSRRQWRYHGRHVVPARRTLALEGRRIDGAGPNHRARAGMPPESIETRVIMIAGASLAYRNRVPS